MKKIVIVELTAIARVIPLVSSYLQAYACKDPLIGKTYNFEKFSVTVQTPYEKILWELERFDADVYGFSCYCWNMGLVKTLLKTLLERKSHAFFILGGPQVERYAWKYIDPKYENVVVCNGEGERTFYHFLIALTKKSIDFSNIKGVSFYQGNRLITTDDEKRIDHLDEIPSPYLNNLIETDKYSTVVFETNRGCPFNCKFCYWGSHTTQITKFSEERIRNELEWLSAHRFFYIWIIDGNWGLLKRDIEFSKHIAACKRKYDMPFGFFFSRIKE